MEQPTTRNIPWVEKYRPASLDNVVSQDSIVRTLKRLVASGNLPHLLFYGPAGTGKTSTVVALAREIFGQEYKNHVLELNASDERGIDIVRENIKTFASSAILFSSSNDSKNLTDSTNESVPTDQLKLVILDEADAMTTAAQFALRRVIERYTRTTRFCFLCNNEQKIIPAIQSRCTRFRFKPVAVAPLCHLLLRVAETEGFKVAGEKDPGLVALATAAEGDVRKALNILSALRSEEEVEEMGLSSSSSGVQRLSIEAVHRAAGLASPSLMEAIIDSALRDSRISDIYEKMQAAMAGGASAVSIVNHCAEAVARMGIPVRIKSVLLKGLGEADDNIQIGCSVKGQLLGVCGLFIMARETPGFKST